MKEKVVFISHSSMDAEFAQKVCSVMESNNLPCWIAPRDIPYGNYWCEEIVNAISQAKVMLFIFTKNSNNKSDQVVREIHQAVKNGVTIIPIRLTTDNYNASINYFISLNHWLQIDKDNTSCQLTELARRITLFINDTDYTTDSFFNKYFENLDLAIDESVNIDEQFENSPSKITIFGPLRKKRKKKDPSFRDKLIQRAGEMTLNNMFKEENLPERSEEEVKENENPSADDSSDNSSEADDNGRFFRCFEAKNCDTFAFMVRYIIDENNFNRIYTTEQIKKETEERSNGDKDAYFYFNEPDYEGNPMVFATIDNDKKIITWGNGFMDADILKISDTPANIHEFKISDKYNQSVVRYAANENSCIILDYETRKVIEHKKYFDKASGQWKYYVELMKNKSYLMFRVNSSAKNNPANPFNIGYGYYKGRYGLHKNIIEAATWFEKAGTKEAYFYLAEIFKNDPVLKNEDDYNYYLNLYNSSK